MQKDNVLETSISKKEDSLIEKSMQKRKPPLIKIDLAGFIGDALATIGAWALLLWLIAALVAAIKATHLIEG